MTLMELGGLRTLVRDLNFAAFGLAVTIERAGVDEAPVAVTGIWLTPLTTDVPAGADLRRRDVRRVMAFSTAELSSCPRGAVVMAPLADGGTIKRWRVDGVERSETEHIRAVLVPDFELDA